MKEFVIRENEAGQRFDKYLKKRLPEAGSSFLYKMLRKKNFVLNGKRADGSEKLNIGDEVKLFLSDETYEKFAGASSGKELKDLILPRQNLSENKLSIIYEDEDILLINKPAGMLSQKAKETDISANELILSYLAETGKLKEEDLETFRPSVCNRLDRNTTGILIAGKSLKGLQEMSAALKSRELKKYYHCIVKGALREKKNLKGWLLKDQHSNKVTLKDQEFPGSVYVETEYEPLKVLESPDEKDTCTLLEVHLITGKTHQIRAHLSSIGHPIAGDPKYGDLSVNRILKQKTGLSAQLLHAKRIVLPDGRTFEADYPKHFKQVLAVTGGNYGNL